MKFMQEKIDFFKKNNGRNSVDYNTVSGQLTIINENQQILYQRNDPKFDVFKEFEVSKEDVQHIRVCYNSKSRRNMGIQLFHGPEGAHPMIPIG